MVSHVEVHFVLESLHYLHVPFDDCCSPWPQVLPNTGSAQGSLEKKIPAAMHFKAFLGSVWDSLWIRPILLVCLRFWVRSAQSATIKSDPITVYLHSTYKKAPVMYP